MPYDFVIKVYIDIDGVLIRNTKSGPKLIPRFSRVIKYLKNNFDCFWLTTHVKHDSGSAGAVKKLSGYLKEAKVSPKILDGIRPTTWQTLKTEAIDFGQPFIWLDDDLLSAEYRILRERRCLESLVPIDWKKRRTRLTVRRLKKCRGDTIRRIRNLSGASKEASKDHR